MKSNTLLRRDMLLLERARATEASALIERIQRGVRREDAVSQTTLAALNSARSALEDSFHQITYKLEELTSEIVFAPPDLPTQPPIKRRTT